jgi:hypothetical protein
MNKNKMKFYIYSEKIYILISSIYKKFFGINFLYFDKSQLITLMKNKTTVISNSSRLSIILFLYENNLQKQENIK